MPVIARRVAARIEGDFVVFLIGARINRWWRLPRHLWFLRTMSKMLDELADRPAPGFLGVETLSPTTNVQYWRSIEDLTAYARDADREHYPYWLRFNREIRSDGDIGIWHETYLVADGQYEAIYNAMPLSGLAKAAAHVDAVGQLSSATGRAGRSDGSDAPITPDGDVTR